MDILRQQAMEWWNQLSSNERREYYNGYTSFTPASSHSELTGREIQNIWAVAMNPPEPVKEEVKEETEGDAAFRYTDKFSAQLNASKACHRETFRDGSKWRKDKDKAIIEELINALDVMTTNYICKVPAQDRTDYQQEYITRAQEIIKKSKQYLNGMFKEYLI